MNCYHNNNNSLKVKTGLEKASRLTALFLSFALFAQVNAQNAKSDSDEELLNRYAGDKGAGIIVFDASNIKQFWIDSSVERGDNSIEIVMNGNNVKGFESIPMKIQLANVREFQDCKVEMIVDTNDVGFSALDEKNKVLSVSSLEEKLLHYTIVSSVFHLAFYQNLCIIFNALLFFLDNFLSLSDNSF